MITVLLLTLAGGLAETAIPAQAPEPASIADFLSKGATGWSDEPERARRCRLYNCGIPIFPGLEKLPGTADEKDRK